MSDIHFQGFWRMDWGLGNPNKTAALIATLAIAVWLIAYIRKWGFWAALVLFTGFGICLVHTFSRGGIVGACAAFAVIIWKLPRPWPRSRIIGVVVSIWTIIGAVLYFQAHERLTQGIIQEDRSITNRLKIWRQTPQMMVDAPDGWENGQAGQAYMQWYQGADNAEEYRTLVNSHLTWLVEWSWPFRFLYILGWLAVLVLCWPSRREDSILAIPFGVWLAFAITATFSSVAESPWLWIVPGLTLLFALGYRAFRHSWLRPGYWIVPIAGAAAILLVFVLLGQGGDIHRSKEVINFGKGTPNIVVFMDEKVFGKKYAKTLREYASTKEGTDLALTIIQPGASQETLRVQTVVAGGSLSEQGKKSLAQSLPGATRIILLNPTFFPQEIAFSPEIANKIEVVFGEFSQSPAQGAWGESVTTRHIEGVGDFVPSWPKEAFSSPPKKSS